MRTLLIALTAMLGGALLFSGTLPSVVRADAPVRLPGHTLAVLTAATKAPVTRAAAPAVDAAPGDQLMLTITLNRSDQQGFDGFLNGVSDPRSPQFHRFLTQTQISDRFGPSQTAYDAVLGFLQKNGFTLVQGSTNRLTLTVGGSRAQAEQAFGVSIDTYTLAGRSFHANDQDPAVPASIAGFIQSVVGLSDLAVPQKAQPQVDTISSGVSRNVQSTQNMPYVCFLAGNDVTSSLLGTPLTLAPPITFEVLTNYLCAAAELDCVAAYAGGNTGITCDRYTYGAPNPASAAAVTAAPRTAISAAPPASNPQRLGLLEYDTFLVSDVADFLAHYGPNAASIGQLQQVHVAGGAGAPGPTSSEVLLDIDAALSLAGGATVAVYDGPFTGANTSFQTMFNAMLTDGDTVISNSWSYCEDQTTLADVQSIDSILANAAAGGVTVFNATGDTGSTCLDGSPNTVGVPAGSPHGVAVGGSSPTRGVGGTYGGETWWDGSHSTPVTGQGGFGVSRFFSRPAYQNAATTAAGRSVPDVVAAADPAEGFRICQASSGGCPNGLLYGGTSASAPIWASFAATLNLNLGHNLGWLNPLIYPLAGTNAFHSPARLSSDFTHVGLGSPNVDALFLGLSGGATGTVSPSVSLVRAFPRTVVADGTTPAGLTVIIEDAAGHTISGKNVTLTPSTGSHAVVSAASGPSSIDNGAVTFLITDAAIETVSFTAADTTDTVVLTQTASVSFVSPPSAAGGISVNPTLVTPDGTSFSTITVTLHDGQGNGASGKTVTLSQNGGHAAITGPTPATTDTTGQVRFKATDTTGETVTFTAVDVTDGNLPVPGAATVTFITGTGCNLGLGTAASGYVVSDFATGFPLDVANSGCSSPVGLAFDGGGNLLVMSPITDRLYRFPSQGGSVGASTTVSATPIPNNVNGNTFGLAFGKDGNLYATQGGGFEGVGGRVVELDPATGQIKREVLAQPGFGISDCALGIATDPLSGDLFTSQPRCTFLGGEPNIGRISAPASATPTGSLYLRPGIADGLTFAPDGTLYTVINQDVVSITGTNGPNPPTSTIVATLPPANGSTVPAGPDGIAVQPNPVNPTHPYLIVNRNDGIITRVDTSTSPATLLDIYSGGSRGDFVTVGPDNCLYATQTDRVIKLTLADGSCPFAPVSLLPGLRISPSRLGPNPQGTTASLTTSFTNVSPPNGTYVTFVVSGANNLTKQVPADASGAATFTYSGAFTGTDTVTASANVGGSTLRSGSSTVTWSAGKHTTFLTLNPSATSGSVQTPVTVTANLTDVSTAPPVAISGQALTFTLGSGPGAPTCSATTAGDGIASCALTPTAAGSTVLTTIFAATGNLLGSTDTRSFFVGAASPTLAYTGPTTATNGAALALTATLKDGAGTALAGKTVSFTLGSGGTAQSCNNTTNGSGVASCSIASVAQTAGQVPLALAFAGDVTTPSASASATVQVAPPADTTPPTTTAAGTVAGQPYTFGQPTPGPVLVTLTPTDNAGGSGVATTYYAVDTPACTGTATASCQMYSAPFSISSNSTHTLTYFSIDRAGNKETLHSATVIIQPSSVGTVEGQIVFDRTAKDFVVTVVGGDGTPVPPSSVRTLDPDAAADLVIHPGNDDEHDNSVPVQTNAAVQADGPTQTDAAARVSDSAVAAAHQQDDRRDDDPAWQLRTYTLTAGGHTTVLRLVVRRAAGDDEARLWVLDVRYDTGQAHWLPLNRTAVQWDSDASHGRLAAVEQNLLIISIEHSLQSQAATANWDANSNKTTITVFSPPPKQTTTHNGFALPALRTVADTLTAIYAPQPAVSQIAPQRGPSTGGTEVTITGTNFDTTGAIKVQFGTTAANGASCSSTTSCVATSPAGSGTVDVTVTTLGGTSAAGATDRFTFTAGCNSGAKADITSPAGGSITTSTPTFQWGGGACVSQYYVYVGSSYGNADLFSSGPLASTVTSATVSPAIPVDGRTVYVRLWSLVNGGFQAVDHSYLMGACQNGSKADISNPAAGTLHGASQTFRWSGGACVTQYHLYIGSSFGTADLLDSGSLPGTLSTQTATLPATGSTVYLRLWSLVNGSWLAVDHSYVSAP